MLEDKTGGIGYRLAWVIFKGKVKSWLVKVKSEKMHKRGSTSMKAKNEVRKKEKIDLLIMHKEMIHFI